MAVEFAPKRLKTPGPLPRVGAPCSHCISQCQTGLERQPVNSARILAGAVCRHLAPLHHGPPAGHSARAGQTGLRRDVELCCIDTVRVRDSHHYYRYYSLYRDVQLLLLLLLLLLLVLRRRRPPPLPPSPSPPPPLLVVYCL